MFEEHLRVAQQAARLAGAIQLEGLGRQVEVQTKASPIDLVTEIDKACEAAVARHIQATFPDHRILAEEGTTGGDNADFCWIIDPLDGTTNYTHHYPHFCISIGMEYQGELVVGAVYDAVHNEMFAARQGGGAFLNDQPIRVSGVPNLLQALLCTGFPGDQAGNAEIMAGWEAMSLHCQGIRRDGSAALDLCYIACGRLDGFWEKLNAWDMAAGVVIVREAGGIVTDFGGERFDVHRREIIASNGPVGAEMVQMLGALS